MKVLGIVGSKRKDGNTSYFVRQALDALNKEGAETRLIFLGDHHISGCTGCEGCKDTCQCILMDDMQEIYPLILDADALVLGSPTYFYNVTSVMKAFIERLYCYQVFAEDDRSVWSSVNEVMGIKYAVVISVCEQNNLADMGFTAEAMRMPLSGLGFRVIETVQVLNLFQKGEALKDEDACAQTLKAAKKLRETLLLREKTEKQIKRLGWP